MTSIGKRDRLISFIYSVTTENDYGEQVETGVAERGKAWARVRYGTGQERREAAQEAAHIAATFECLMNPMTSAVQMTDRIRFDGADWDISSRAPVGRDQVHFTATRSA